ncbi:TPA: hypothetical protein HA259_01710 [Thermoplasmata archaeon]|nr:hypothetical protein [Thermoplasmata archaeon]
MVEVIDYCGERRVWYNNYPGIYEAHHWIVLLKTKFSFRLEGDMRALLEIPSPIWSQAARDYDPYGESPVPLELLPGSTYTIVADGNRRIVSIEEGDTLDRHVSSD